MSFKLLITEIEGQIQIEKAKLDLRNFLAANPHQIIFQPDMKLPEDRSEYLAELEAVLPVLRYLSEPCHPWECAEGGVPDDYFRLYYNIQKHTTIAKHEIPAIVRIAQEFFHDYKPQ